MSVSDFAVPIIIIFVLIFALFKKIDIIGEFSKGINEGLKTVLDIFPALFILIFSIGMFKASGGLGAISNYISPLTSSLGFPKECLPLFLLRPLSGSGAIAVFEDILKQTGADSMPGRIASVMMGSSETTFYTITVYFAATKVKKIRYAVFVALTADILVTIFAVIFTKLYFY